MAETAKMNSQLWTSYSTSYTLLGLAQRYLVVLRRDLTTGPIINGMRLRNFALSEPAYCTLRQVQRRVTIFRVHPAAVCLQLSVEQVALNNVLYKHSLHL